MNLYTTVICKYQFVCTKKWADLEVIEAENDRRHCAECDQYVFLAKNFEDFANLAAARRCVAVIDDQSNGQLLGSPDLNPARVNFVEEADLYLKYGRTEQAIQILKEALDQENSNVDVLFRLLEVYRDLNDSAGFEIYAKKALVLSERNAEWWGKIRAMGSLLDPKNPIFVASEAN